MIGIYAFNGRTFSPFPYVLPGNVVSNEYCILYTSISIFAIAARLFPAVSSSPPHPNLSPPEVNNCLT